MSVSFQADTTLPDIDHVDPARPLTHYLVERLGWNEDGLAARILEAIVEPAIQIVVIVVLALAVLWLLRWLGSRLAHRIAGGVSQTSPRASQRVETVAVVLANIAVVVVWSAAVLTILGRVFGVSLAPFLAGAGILGIALGFGAQDLVRDMISGFFMMAEDQYGVGDVIDVGEAKGTVEAVGIRSTRIRDDNGTLWHVPNGQIRRVGNMSQQWSRVVLDIAVAYDTDIDLATEVITGVATEMAGETDYADEFLSAPEVLGVEEVGADQVVLRFSVRTVAGAQWHLSRQLNRRLKTSLEAAGIPPLRVDEP